MSSKRWAPAIGWAEYQAKRRLKKKNNGICIYCANKAVDKFSRCKEHIAYQRKQRADYYKEWLRKHKAR